jgi:hypothetical protein
MNASITILKGLLITLIAFCAVIFGSPSILSSRTPQHREAYPQVYDYDGDSTLNLFTSTAFKTRHSRFFVELEDSTRKIELSLSDTLGKKSMIVTLRIDSSGRVDSVAIAGCDTTKDVGCKALYTKLHTWSFANALNQRLLVVQELNVPQKYTKSFYQRNKKKVWFGGIILGALLFFL